MVRAVFEKIAVRGSAPRAPVFGTRMFVSSGPRPVADGLLNADYKQNSFNRSDVREERHFFVM
jgi:hypothetical protein